MNVRDSNCEHETSVVLFGNFRMSSLYGSILGIRQPGVLMRNFGSSVLLSLECGLLPPQEEAELGMFLQ